MAGLLNAYTSFLGRRPMLGNIATSAVLFATGDIIAQQAVEKKGLKNHDLARTGRIVVWGAGIFAPLVTVWLRALDKIPIKNKLAGTITKVAADQLIAAPTFLTGFFTVMTLLEGKDLAAAKQKWHESFFPTLKANWTLFVPFQAINLLIPLQYRVLAINAVNIPWNTFLSVQNSKGAKAQAETKSDGDIALATAKAADLA
ncbi:Protein required for ethanol metabolism [Vanrija albida]|uniref:Protein required for ethanol metabolism n=1 Tax=Vanrija albida TaxID=181172 RepID=A0ABR3Q5W4_9TREE